MHPSKIEPLKTALRPRRAALLIAMALMVGAPSAPLGQTAPEQAQPQEAMRLYQIGQLQYEGGEYAQAAETFLAALALDPDATLAYNAARACEKSGQTARAAELYRQQLGLQDQGELADAARARLLILEARLSRQDAEAAQKPDPTPERPAPAEATVSVRADRPGVVRIDGVEVGTAPGRFGVSPGLHEITVEHPEAQTATRTLTLSAGQDVELMFLLEDRAGLADDTLGLTGFGLMGGGVLAGSLALGLGGQGELDATAATLGLTALAMEAVGVGLLLWSIQDDQPRDEDRATDRRASR